MYLLLSNWHVLWFVRVAIVVVLFCVVMYRRVPRELPLFSALIGWLAFAGMVMLWMDYSPLISAAEYRRGINIDTAVENTLAFAAVYELLRNRLRDYPRLNDSGMSAFRWLAIILAIMGIALAWYIPVGQPWPIVPVRALLIRTLRTLECGLLLFIAAYCSYFRLPWRKYTLGITIGLAFYMGSSLAMNAIRAQIEPYGKTFTRYALDFSNEIVYITSAVIWLAYLLVPEEGTEPTSSNFPPHDLGAWNRELGGF